MLTIRTSERNRAEKEYILSVLLGEMLGIAWQIKAEPRADYRLELPNGSALHLADRFFSTSDMPCVRDNVPTEAHIVGHPFRPEENVVAIYGSGTFELENQDIQCGIDLFASAFFMLTRWEEHVRPERDAHGRFPARAALAHRANFLDRPVVNEYADLLWDLLQHLGWAGQRLARQFRMHLSCDVDHPRLWWSGGARWRTLAGSIWHRRSFSEVFFWLRNHVFQARDPYDVFDEWMEMAEKKHLHWHFNFLGDRAVSSDCYYPLGHPFIRGLLEKMAARGHYVGFHPSYEAFADTAQFAAELASLRAISPDSVRHGRQHYLRFSVPDTWRMWDAAGLDWDSSLGYSEAEGFRCGICHDFPAFDFLARKTLRLREKPLVAMDVTLALYQKYSPEKAAERLRYLRQQTEKHQGEFVLLWHNSSWNTYFWTHWKFVLQDFLDI